MALFSIQDLIAAGDVAVYGDLRSGVYLDRSGNSNDGTPNKITLDFEGGTYDAIDSYISILDDATLKGITEGCFIMLADDFTVATQAYMYKKAGGPLSDNQFVWRTTATGFRLDDSTTTRTLNAPIDGFTMHAVNFKNGEIPQHFSDGNFAGQYSGTLTFVDKAANLIIGNLNTLTGFPFANKLRAFAVLTRNLTLQEHAELFQSFDAEQYFGEAEPFQEGDVDLFQTVDDGNIAVENGFVRMTGRLGTATYLSLFGGNENDPGGEDTSESWWGNIGEDPVNQYRSETQYLLRAIPAISANLIKIEQAADRDLAWMKEIGAATEITISTSIPAPNRISIIVNIDGDETLTYVANWEAQQ
jgi:phage gp46-like protein